MSPEYIKEILQKIRTEYNIDDLANYRAFFKKHVPFFMRSWFAAALMLELDGSPASRRAPNGGRASRSSSRSARGAGSAETPAAPRKGRDAEKNRNTDRSGSPARDSSTSRDDARLQEQNKVEPSPRVVIPEDEASTLFFSAGRKRRVYPRDIVGFVLKESSVEREDIGDIRILDNFSFIQVRKLVADTLIDELNEKPFRGRNLTVSYAKPRPDPADVEYASADSDDDRGADSASDADLENEAVTE